MKGEYGESSSIFRSRVLAEFPTEAIEAITTRANLERAFARHETAIEESGAAAGLPVVLSWDVARSGADLNAMAICQGLFVREITTWRAPNINDSYSRVQSAAEMQVDRYSTRQQRQRARNDAYENNGFLPERIPYRPELVIDEAGLGGPAVDEMRKRGFAVTGFIGAASATENSRYLNKRAEAYFLFRLALEHGTVALPRNEQLLEEALATEWMTNSSDRIQIIAKDEVRRAIGRSPDVLDAVVVGLWYTLSQAMLGKWGSSNFTL